MSAHAGLWWRLQISFFFSILTCSKVKLITEILQKDVVYRIFRNGVSRQNATKKVAGSWKRLETLECALKKYMYHIYIEREREIDIGCRNHICSEGMWMCHFRCRFSLKSAFCTLRQVFPKWRNTKDVTAPTNVSPWLPCVGQIIKMETSKFFIHFILKPFLGAPILGWHCVTWFVTLIRFDDLKPWPPSAEKKLLLAPLAILVLEGGRTNLADSKLCNRHEALGVLQRLYKSIYVL